MAQQKDRKMTATPIYKLPAYSTQSLTRSSGNLMENGKSYVLFVCEASDLTRGGSLSFGRLYDDACDVGLVLISHKTGLAHSFYLAATERDMDNDVRWWDLHNDEIPMRVRVFND